MILTLPTHLVHDILVNLPVKSHIQFKYVSKACQSLIQDSSFLELLRARSKEHPQILIQIQDDCDHSKIILSPEDGLNGGMALRKVKIPWAKQARRMLKQSINGLFCFVDNSDRVTCIYNLGTGEVTPWAQTSVNIGTRGVLCITQQPIYGFGFDPLTNNYKILCVRQICRPTNFRWYENNMRMPSNVLEYVCEVFTVGENQWRKIDEVPPVVNLAERDGVYANGSIYYRNAADPSSFSRTPDTELIVAFDVGTEKFRSIEIPGFIFSSSSRRCLGGGYLLQIDGHIALVDVVDVARENKHVVKLWICDDDICNKEKKKMMETKWTEETILLPFSCSIARSFLYPVEGTSEIVIETPDFSSAVLVGKGSPRPGCGSLYVYERIMKNFRKIDITGIPLPLMFRLNYQLFIYHENLLPIHQKPVEEDTSEIVDMDFEYY